MTERQRFTLWEPVQAHKIITLQLWPLLKSMLMAGQRVVVEIKPETRTLQDVVPGIDGGFVVLGKSTSKMTKPEMSELQDLIEAFGAQQGVRFTAPEYVDPETGEIT